MGVGAGGRRVSTTSKPRAVPDLDAEQEVDVGRYWARVVSRWWLPLIGLCVGILLGYLISVGGGKVYRAEALVYLGQPFSPDSSAPVFGLATDPRTIGEIVRSETALKQAARVSGLPLGQLRGKVSTTTVSGGSGVARSTQLPLVRVSVQGDAPVKVERAANALASRAVNQVSSYVDLKIDEYRRQIETRQAGIDSIDRRLDTLNQALETAQRQNRDPLDLLVIATQADNAQARRTSLIEQQSRTETQLAMAQQVERSRVLQRASAEPTTARSTRNSIVVMGAIGLLLGLIAALIWDPVAGRSGRAAA
jgi:uncharacterized protein involved in exopolysaccharide biosynthesis